MQMFIYFISGCVDHKDITELSCADTYYSYGITYGKDPGVLCFRKNTNRIFKKQCCKTCEGMSSFSLEMSVCNQKLQILLKTKTYTCMVGTQNNHLDKEILLSNQTYV